MTPKEMIERARNGRVSALQSLQAREGNLLYFAHFRGDKRKERAQPMFVSTRATRPARVNSHKVA